MYISLDSFTRNLLLLGAKGNEIVLAQVIGIILQKVETGIRVIGYRLQLFYSCNNSS